MKSISVLTLAGIVAATNYPDLVIPYLTTHQPNGDKFSYYYIDFNVTTQTGGAHTAWCWASWGDDPRQTPVNEWISCTTEQNGQELTDISFELPRQVQIGDFDLVLRQNFTENIDNTPIQMITTTSPFHFSNTTSSLPYNCTINPYMNPYNIHASGDCSTTSSLSLPITAGLPACQHAKIVTLTFPIQVRTQYGESIYITGSIPELGNWDLSHAVPLNADSYTNEPNGDVWTGGDVKVAAGTSFEWKAVQKNIDGSWLWECGDNWKATVDSYTCGEQTIGNVQTNGVLPTWMRCADH